MIVPVVVGAEVLGDLSPFVTQFLFILLPIFPLPSFLSLLLIQFSNADGSWRNFSPRLDSRHDCRILWHARVAELVLLGLQPIFNLYILAVQSILNAILILLIVGVVGGIVGI